MRKRALRERIRAITRAPRRILRELYLRARIRAIETHIADLEHMRERLPAARQKADARLCQLRTTMYEQAVGVRVGAYPTLPGRRYATRREDHAANVELVELHALAAVIRKRRVRERSQSFLVLPGGRA